MVDSDRAIAQTDEPAPRRPLRLWPGVVAAVLLLVVRFGVRLVVPGFEGYRIAVFGGFFGVLAILVWWLFFSRARWFERLGAIILMALALAATWRINHESMGIMWCLIYAVPVLSLALVAWAVAGRRLADGPRRAALVAIILLASGVWSLVRMDGMTGNHDAEFAWRWAETPEDRLLARAGDQQAAIRSAPAAIASAQPVIPPAPAVTPSAPAVITSAPAAAATQAGWPGFRGPGRDAVLSGVRIETDWSQSPPVELWRRPVGPGWSSFAVRGDLLYSQEQRGDDEVVTCSRASTGEPVWGHRDAVRFFEAMGGVGPRATPTLSNGRVYTLGATGILNALDAADGAVVWSRNVAADTGMSVPIWGFSSSPLVVDDTVIVAAGGRLVGYDLASGDLCWLGPDGGPSYSSPHRVTIDGVDQILLLNDAGVTSLAPADGALLWEHAWPGAPIVQPALTAEGDVLISAGEGEGLRRIDVTHRPGGWTIEERWTSNRLKPNFNDFVVHDGHAFGFDGSMLACIDLEDGKRRWKGGRYGHGQLVLLADQDLLLVLSEKGELALVAATPGKFTELARSPAIEGKTWNHPALVGDLLLVRNGEEMAAFRLPLARR